MVRSGAKGQAWIELNKDVCLGGRALEGARRGKESPRVHLGFFG